MDQTYRVTRISPLDLVGVSVSTSHFWLNPTSWLAHVVLSVMQFFHVGWPALKHIPIGGLSNDRSPDFNAQTQFGQAALE